MSPGTTAIRLGLIDGVTLRVDGVARVDLPHGVQRFVAYLGLTGRPGRGAVAGQLWPEIPEDQAQRRLRTVLWRAQKSVPGLVEPFGGALGLGTRVQLDVRELVTWSRRVLDPTAPLDDCVRDDPRVDGELLPGWYDEWVLLERERLRQLRLHVWEALSEKLAASGRYGQAVDAAHEAIRLAPLRESAHRALIRALAAEGNLDEALRAFEQFEARLADELGFAPSVQLEAYVHRLLRLKATTAPGLRPPER